MNIKDAYLHILVFQPYKLFLRFVVEDHHYRFVVEDHHYQFVALEFGFPTASRMFIKVLVFGGVEDARYPHCAAPGQLASSRAIGLDLDV